MSAKKNLYKLVVIRPIGRSGSVFLQSLFDNHPEILSFPFVFPFYLHWNVFLSFPEKTLDRLISYFTNETHLKYLFMRNFDLPYTIVGKSGKMPRLTIPKAKFLQQLKTDLARMSNNVLPTRREFLISLHTAYARAAGIPLSNRKVIVLHEHGSYNYQDPNDDFRDVLNVVTIREPRNSYASFIGYRMRMKAMIAPFYNILDLDGWVDGYINARTYTYRFPRNIHYIKTEELNSNPKKQMIILAKRIGISFHETLLSSTYAGYELALGFSSFAEKKKGFDPKGMKKNRWSSLCSEREIEIVDILFGETSKLFYNRTLKKRSLTYGILTILKPDVQVLRLRYTSVSRAMQYVVFLHPLWMRLCFVRNLIRIRCADRNSYIPMPLRKMQLFDIVLYKLQVKKLLGVKG